MSLTSFKDVPNGSVISSVVHVASKGIDSGEKSVHLDVNTIYLEKANIFD